MSLTIPASQGKDLRSLGTRLILARSRSGISQEALAEQLGTNQQYVSRVERDLHDPHWRRLVEWARIIECSLDWLANGDNAHINSEEKETRNERESDGI